MQPNYPIVLAATENYIPFAAVLITSIIQNTHKIMGGGQNSPKGDIPYHFHILSDSLSQTTQEKLFLLQSELSKIYPCAIQCYLVDDSPFKDFPNPRGNYVGYYLLKFEKYLPKEINKALYIDIDMLVCCDLRELFAIDIEQKTAGVVLDYFSERHNLKGKNNNENLSTAKEFFNGGMLLVDMKKWRNQEIESLFKNIASSYIWRPYDQDLLNIALFGRTKILPLNYNVLVYYYANSKTCDEEKKYNVSYTRKELNDALKNPKILHYYLGYKPWKDDKIYVDTKGEFLGKYWWDIAQKTPIFAKEIMELKESASRQKAFQGSLGFALLKLARARLYPLISFKACLEIKRIMASNQSSCTIPKEDYNLCIEIGKEALKAYNKGKGRLFTLPFKIINLEKRFQLAKKRLENL